MAGVIGKSTGPETAVARADVPGPEVASFRYNNPGAQYPAPEAARFGQIGYGIIGNGSHKIARFPSPVNGAASNFDLLFRIYTGMTIGAAGYKWTGSLGFGIPGYPSERILTREMLEAADSAIALLKAIAHRESGKGNNLSEEQWRQAHRMFRLGSADAFLEAEPKLKLAVVGPAGQPSGEGLLRRALEHVGEDYRNVRVPKDDAHWKGPWDCAEFVSWLVYQEAGILYGCVDDTVPPSVAEAYTGAWKADLERLGTRVPVAQAAATAGGILLRYPPRRDAMGHIAICDGAGGTVEAKGARYGVVRDTVQGRDWDAGILISSHLAYKQGQIVPVAQPATVYKPGAPNMNAKVVAAIQEALLQRGLDPGGVDGDYGRETEAAVVEFQRQNGLTVDGQVGPETAAALGISLTSDPVPSGPAAEPGPAPTQGDALATIIPALIDLIGKLSAGKEKPMAEESPRPSTAVEDVLLLLLRALLDGKPIDSQRIAGLIAALGAGAVSAPAARMLPPPIAQPQAGATAPTPDERVAALTRLLQVVADALAPAAADSKKPLGPVNGALGQTIGNLIDGRKSAIGIIGAALTQMLSTAEPGTMLSSIAGAVPALAGTSSTFLPIFLALTAWGFLGKGEKWFTGRG